MSSPARSPVDEITYWRERAAALESENTRLRATNQTEAAQRFRDLFEQAPVAYHELDLNGIVRRVNEAECRLFGLRPEEILGRPAWDFVSEQEREISRRTVFEKLSGQRPLRPFFRHYATHHGETLTLEVHENLIRDAAGDIKGIRTAL